MDIEKYYWEAKDENEARVITAILAKFFDNKHGLRGIYSASTLYYFIANEGCLDVSSCREDLPSMSKRSTIPDLLEMALRGFKERWEVAPEGYRLVTEEERREFPFPECSLNFALTNKEAGWKTKIRYGNCWDDPRCMVGSGDEVFYAVPLDFTFLKPWEVAPEGYRLVTEEERKKYPKPSGMMHTEINWDGEWYVDSGPYLWRTSGFFFAVPIDFTFEPEVKEMSAEEISDALGYTVKVVK